MSDRLEKLEAKLERAKEMAAIEAKIADLLEQRKALLADLQQLRAQLRTFVNPRAHKEPIPAAVVTKGKGARSGARASA